MVEVTGTAKKCVELAKRRDDVIVQGMKNLSKKHEELIEEASKRLAAVEN